MITRCSSAGFLAGVAELPRPDGIYEPARKATDEI